MESYLTPSFPSAIEERENIETVFTWLRIREALTDCVQDPATGEWINRNDLEEYVKCSNLSAEEEKQYLIDLKSL